MILAVGLTGGIASGKSAVATQFANIDVPVIDADAISHALVQPGQPSLVAIRNIFGGSVISISGKLDRKKMRAIVFEDENARKKLEYILHPRVRATILDEVRQCQTPYCIVVIPLLAENKEDYSWIDRILVTDAPRAAQIERLTRRPEIDIALAHRIIDAQAPRDERLALANDVIDNTAPIDRLSNVVNRLHERYLTTASRQQR